MQIHIRIEQGLADRIRAEKNRTGLTISGIVKVALSEYLLTQSRKEYFEEAEKHD